MYCLCVFVFFRCVSLCWLCSLMVLISWLILLLNCVNWVMLFCVRVCRWLLILLFCWYSVSKLLYWLMVVNVVVICVWIFGFLMCICWCCRIFIVLLSCFFSVGVFFWICFSFRFIIICCICRVLRCSLFIWLIYLRLILISWLSVFLVVWCWFCLIKL